MMTRCREEQGDCNPSLSSSIGHRTANLHGSGYWKAFPCLDAVRYRLTYRTLTLHSMNGTDERQGADSGVGSLGRSVTAVKAQCLHITDTQKRYYSSNECTRCVVGIVFVFANVLVRFNDVIFEINKMFLGYFDQKSII